MSRHVGLWRRRAQQPQPEEMNSVLGSASDLVGLNGEVNQFTWASFESCSHGYVWGTASAPLSICSQFHNNRRFLRWRIRNG
jgi:hypothetical protein